MSDFISVPAYHVTEPIPRRRDAILSRLRPRDTVRLRVHARQVAEVPFNQFVDMLLDFGPGNLLATPVAGRTLLLREQGIPVSITTTSSGLPTKIFSENIASVVGNGTTPFKFEREQVSFLRAREISGRQRELFRFLYGRENDARADATGCLVDLSAGEVERGAWMLAALTGQDIGMPRASALLGAIAEVGSQWGKADAGLAAILNGIAGRAPFRTNDMPFACWTGDFVEAVKDPDRFGRHEAELDVSRPTTLLPAVRLVSDKDEALLPLRWKLRQSQCLPPRLAYCMNAGNEWKPYFLAGNAPKEILTGIGPLRAIFEVRRPDGNG